MYLMYIDIKDIKASDMGFKERRVADLAVSGAFPHDYLKLNGNQTVMGSKIWFT